MRPSRHPVSGGVRSPFLPNRFDLEPRRQRFLEQERGYHLQYRCEVCTHFDPQEGKCSLSFPAGLILNVTDGPFAPNGDWIFCKYWDLNA
jgi:hypothetical protein